MAEQGPVSAKNNPRVDGVRRGRHETADPELEIAASFKLEQEQAIETRLNLMEACVAWDGLYECLLKIDDRALMQRMTPIHDELAPLKLYLAERRRAIPDEIMIQELRAAEIEFKFDLAYFIDIFHKKFDLNPYKKGFKQHPKLTRQDYLYINKNLNILKLFANRRELIIELNSRVLRAGEAPVARLATKTEPTPGTAGTADPATAAAGAPIAADPTATAVGTTSTEPTPAVVTLDTTTAAGEPGPATATTPDSSAAAPDAVTGGNPNSGDTTNPVGGPDSTQTSHEADPGVVFEHYGLWSEKDADIKLSQEVIDALEQIEDKESGLYTASNLLKYVVDSEGRKLLPDRGAANTLLDLLLREGIVT